jgi:lipid-A-disaccharide synthase
VNLILDRAAVKELIQAECSVQKIVAELGKIEEGKEGRSKLIKDYDNLVQLLGEKGASARIAENMLQNL